MQKKACEKSAKFEFNWNSQNYSKKFDSCILEKSREITQEKKPCDFILQLL